MSIDAKLSLPIDETDPDLAGFLSDLQGNILKGHGRDHTLNRFLQFREGHVEAVRRALGRLAAGGFLTSAARQLADTRSFKAGGPGDRPVVLLVLSATGYHKLGIADGRIPADPAFRAGMRARNDAADPGAGLQDPPVAGWDDALRHAADAMLLVAALDAGTARAHADQLCAGFGQCIHVLGDETGLAQRNADHEGIEHFGYVDGRSQPLLLLSDAIDELAHGGISKWDPLFPPSQTVLVPDPGGTGPDSFGSYFVFRKLEQNVRAFKQGEQDLADALGLTGKARERAGAMVIGRFEDGTPLILDTTEKGVPVRNNFSYDGDPDGRICPMAAHIRKSNPRGGIRKQFDIPNDPDDLADRRPIMARRGITYGVRTDGPNDDQIGTKPTGGVGLLFMAYQRSIVEQFEFTQKTWVNNENFLRPATAVDPVIGQGGTLPQSWPVPDQPDDASFRFAGHVTLKGGEYFFAPSLGFLRSLAAAPVA